MRIFGFDLDDVIANSGPLFHKTFAETTGLPVVNRNAYRLEDVFGVSLDFVQDWMKKYSQEVYSVCNPYDFSVDVLTRLARHSIIEIISSRHLEDGYITLQWLKTHKIPCDHLYLVGNDRNKINFLRNKKVDLYVDNLIEVLNALEGKDCVLILFGRESSSDRILSVSDWEELEECVNRVFSSSSKV